MTDTVRDLVSVVIPAYNAARWIGHAVASARAQEGARVEIIVADNGSTDDTVEQALRAGPVTIVRATRRGPSAARNAGLAASRGEFVQFLDADDLLGAGKIARQVAMLRATGADVAWGSFTRFRDGHEAPFDARAHVPALGDDVAADLIRAEGFLHLGAALFRRSTIGSLRFDEGQPVVEDVRFLLALALAGAGFVRDPGSAAYALREHEAASRASRVADAVFYDACVANARMLRDAWRAAGEPLTPDRVAALASVYLTAAEVFALVAPDRLDATVGEARALDPHLRSRLRRPHRTLVPLLGYRRTFALARSVKRVRDSLLRR